MTSEERCRLIQSGENKAENLERLFFDNMGLWVYALQPYKSLADFEELKQQAFLSVTDAALRYDPERGTFANYACMIIRQDIPVYLASCGRWLSYPQWLLNRKAKYNKLIADGITDEKEQARLLGVSVESVRQLAMQVVSLDGEGGLVDNLQAQENTEEIVLDRIGAEDMRREVWEEVEKRISGRRLDIVKSLFVDGETVASIAKRCGVSAQYISEQKRLALRKLEGSRVLRELAEDYQIASVLYYYGGLRNWKRTGTSCVERAVMEREKIDTDKRKVYDRMMARQERMFRDLQIKREVQEEFERLQMKYSRKLKGL